MNRKSKKNLISGQRYEGQCKDPDMDPYPVSDSNTTDPEYCCCLLVSLNWYYVHSFSVPTYLLHIAVGKRGARGRDRVASL
jgi:hypothetical protein